MRKKDARAAKAAIARKLGYPTPSAVPTEPRRTGSAAVNPAKRADPPPASLSDSRGKSGRRVKFVPKSDR